MEEQKNLLLKRVLVMQDKEVVNHLTSEVEQYLWGLFKGIIHFHLIKKKKN